MKANQNILWLIAGLYIFISWIYLLIVFVVFKSYSYFPLIVLAGMIFVTIIPISFWLRHTIVKVKKMYEKHQFREIIEYVKQKPYVVFNQDLENIYLYLAIAHWSLKESDQFQNYLDLIRTPKMYAIRDMWIIIDHLVNHGIYDAEEYYKTLLINAKTVKPVLLRKTLPKRLKDMIDLAKNKSNKETYLQLFKQASNPRVIAYLNEFEEDYM